MEKNQIEDPTELERLDQGLRILARIIAHLHIDDAASESRQTPSGGPDSTAGGGVDITADVKQRNGKQKRLMGQTRRT